MSTLLPTLNDLEEKTLAKHVRKAIADTADLDADTADIYTEISRRTD